MKTVLDIHGLSKKFDKQAILQDLHLTIREGDILWTYWEKRSWENHLDKNHYATTVCG